MDIVMLAAVDWNYIAQAQQIFARYFAEHGFNVVYVEPFPHRFPRVSEVFVALSRVVRFLKRQRAEEEQRKDIKGRITVITPMGLPETNGLFRLINMFFFVKKTAERIKGLCGSAPVVQCWTPYETCLELSRLLAPRLLVYSCVDNFLAMNKAPKNIGSTEIAFLRESDLVVAKSEYVAERLRKTREEILMRDSAVEFDLFQKADRGPVREVKRLCFFGYADDRLDFGIITALAEKGYEVLLLGPFRVKEIRAEDLHSNITCHPSVPYEEVPDHLRDVDCIILPYRVDNEFNRGMHLAKLYECFATGKPVVATPIPCMLKFPGLVYLGSTPEEFVSIVENIPVTEDRSVYEKRVELARKNSWPERFRQELAWINDALALKERETPDDRM